MEKVQYYTHDITKTGVLSEVPLLTLHAIKFQEASVLTYEAKNAASYKLYFFHWIYSTVTVPIFTSNPMQ